MKLIFILVTLWAFGINSIAAAAEPPSPPGLSDSGKLNINSATAKTIDLVLVGVGPSKAQAIVDYREKYGQFESLSELEEVKGIGSSIVKKMRKELHLKIK